MATHTKETLLAIVEKLRYDTTNIQMNVSELARAIANLPIPEPKAGTYKCPHDNLTFPTTARLAEHLDNVHHDYRERAALKNIAAEREDGRFSGVAFSHAHTAEGDPSSAGSDMSSSTGEDVAG